MIAEKRYHVYMVICGTLLMLEHELKTMFEKYPEILQTPFGVCGDYLLHCAIKLNASLPVMKVLLCCSSLASTQKDCNGRGILHLAIIHATDDIICTVIDFYPMLINDADNNNIFPLH